MRGNHIHLGRQDYSEPAPISSGERALVESCVLVKRPSSKFWHDVYRAGKFVGGVAVIPPIPTATRSRTVTQPWPIAALG